MNTQKIILMKIIKITRTRYMIDSFRDEIGYQTKHQCNNHIQCKLLPQIRDQMRELICVEMGQQIKNLTWNYMNENH